MSFISKDHFNMALKGIKRILNQKADKSELNELQEEILDKVADSAIQPDWNETDETSSAYIQNKPFEESGLEYVFVDLENAPMSAQAAAVLSSTCEYELIPGNIYKVIINGVEKEIECVVPNVYPNRKCLMLDTNSNHSNKVIFQDNNKSYIYSFTAWGNGASVKVIGRTQPPKKLSEQYIPNTIARVSDVDEAISSEKGKIFYGTCSTSSSTSAKVATVNGSSFVLRQGAMICIYFTYKCNSGSMTLNVNNTGAKSIRLSNSTSLAADCWGSDTYVTFLYDGAYWNIISVSISNASATTSKYGLTMLSSSTSSTSTSLAATPSAVKKAYDLANAALPKSGGTLTGNLTLTGDPTSNLHAATKQYVDNAVKNVNIPEQVNSDWNQNDTNASSYVKNRPFYEEVATEEIVIELVAGAPTVVDDDLCAKLFDNKETATYVINGKKAEYGGDAAVDGCTWACFVFTTDVPYVCCYGNGTLSFCSLTMDEYAPGTISFSAVTNVVHQLDEKFIPDTIARKTDIPKVDLTGYATEQYVNNAIALAIGGVENGAY